MGDGGKGFADGGQGVEIVWVVDESGVLLAMVQISLSPMEFLNKLFDKFDYTTDDSEGEKKVSCPFWHLG